MKKLTLASLLMTSSLLFSRIIGFLRDAVIASKFGSGIETDAYFAAFTLPDFLNYLVAGGAFSLTFIPIFTAYMVKNQEDKGWKLYSIIISVMSVVLIISIVLLEIFTPQIIRAMFPGFDDKTLNTTILFTRIVLPAQLFFYNGGIISAILLAKKKFLMPALAPLVYNISIILFGLLFSGYGMIGFAAGALTGAFLGPFGLQFWALKKEIKFKVNFNVYDRDFVNFIKKSLPIMLGLILVTLDDWLGKRYGSFLGNGTISYLNNSRRLVLVPIGLFAQANAQAVLPFLSELYAKGELKKFNELAKKTLTLVFFITSFAASWFTVFHYEIIKLIYLRGAFGVKDASNTGSIFLFLSLSIPFWSSIIILSRFYYAHHNTKTPMIIGGIMTLISLPLYSFLSSKYGASGLALSVAFVKVLYFSVLFLYYKKINSNFDLFGTFKDILKMILFFGAVSISIFVLKFYFSGYSWFIVAFLLSVFQFVVTLFLAKFIRISAYNEFKEKYLNRVLRKIGIIL